MIKLLFLPMIKVQTITNQGDFTLFVDVAEFCSQHDKKLAKEGFQKVAHWLGYYYMIGDKGYQGMQKVNSHFLLPIKEKQGGLSQAEKNYNTSFSKVRLVVEHTYMRLKECYKAFSQVWTLRRSKLEDMVVFAIGIQNYMTTKNPMFAALNTTETQVSPGQISRFRIDDSTESNNNHE
ncbi:IS5_family transposase [Hexamita inflata]|uniref:IS5 family transposase n=1 Tax=Hexamita inflata TaxID=28002 RepID=A0AA86QFR1_9EUKA|nr:IS5 family transposase [Hexamita inflata]